MLTRRKQEFVKHYITTKNATEAAKMAGYSLRTAYSTGSRLLKTIEVSKEIEAYFNRSKLENEDIVRLISEIASTGKVEANRLRALEISAKMRGLLKETDTKQGVSIALFANDLPKRVEAEVDKSVNNDVTT